jgi:hypothetical protein
LTGSLAALNLVADKTTVMLASVVQALIFAPLSFQFFNRLGAPADGACGILARTDPVED